MANNFVQLATIVDRLLDRTTQGKVTWNKSATRGQFQARFDDFLIQIGGVRTGTGSSSGLSNIFNNGGSLRITTLAGALVDEVLADPLRMTLGSITHNSAAPPQEFLNKIQKLYDLVASESEDLNRLLKAIG